MAWSRVNRRQMVVGSAAMLAIGTFGVTDASQATLEADGEGLWETLYGFDVTWSEDWVLYEQGSYSLPEVGQETVVLSLDKAFPDGTALLTIDLAPADPGIGDDPFAWLEETTMAGYPAGSYTIADSDAGEDGAWLLYHHPDTRSPSAGYAEVRLPESGDDPVMHIRLSGQIERLDVEHLGKALKDVEIDGADAIGIGDADDVFEELEELIDA